MWKKDDHIAFTSNGQNVIGRVEEILPDAIIKVSLYYTPEQIKGGRQLYHGANEIMRTDLSLDIPPSSIICSVDVIVYKDYKLKYPSFTTVPPNIYVMRQKYNTKAEISVPELQKQCHCVSFISPDDNIMLCPDCDESIHNLCIDKDSTKMCPKCKKILVDLQTLFDDYKKKIRISNPLLELSYVMQ